MADLLKETIVKVLQGKALQIVENGLDYGSTREILKSTIDDLKPEVQKIKQHKEKMGLPADEDIEKLITEMEASQKLIDNTEISLWNFFLMPCYQRKLEKENKSMMRSIKFLMLIQMMKCVKVKDIQQYKLSGHDGHNRLAISAADNHSNLKVPEEYTVGILDGPLMELKFELLKDGDHQVLNLTGMAGLGKTTLAKHLCLDPQIKREFMDNIVFETLGQQNESNEHQVVKELQYRLQEIGNERVLLVLDNVWPGSEELVKQFRVQMSSDSKILVISRIALPEIGTTYHMKVIKEKEDAEALFLQFVQPSNIDVEDEQIRSILLQIVEGCKGLPLALKFMGSKLRGKTIEKWQKELLEWSQGHCILDSSIELLTDLQNSLLPLQTLEDESINECFMDLGLFPEDQRIPVSALIDMLIELYKLDEHGISAMNIINELTAMNLADMTVTRKVGSEADNYYNNHFLMQHSILRELAIRTTKKEPFEKRKRLIVDINGNNRPEWWPQQQGICAHIQSCLPIEPMLPRVSARIVSISTDQNLTPDWCNIKAAEAEVLVLNLKTKEYTIPEFMRKMKNLKVVMVMNYVFHHTTELKDFDLLGSLWNLKRIRLQKVSVPCLCQLKNLHKLSLYMCEVNNAFENCHVPFSKAVPNLVELNIEYCQDMVKLPSGVCDIVTLKKVDISSCQKFIELPKEIGKLENLELLRVSHCAEFREIAESITRLERLTFLDISYCHSLRTLPENIDGLKNLRKLYMTDSPIHGLPDSVMKMQNLKFVICDDYTYPFWEIFKYDCPSLNIRQTRTLP